MSNSEIQGVEIIAKNFIVQRCVIDNNISVRLEDCDARIFITINNGFQINLYNDHYSVDPNTNSNVKLLVLLLGKAVRSITVTYKSVLVIDFDENINITVHPHLEYEAWTVTIDGDPPEYWVGAPL